MTKRRDVLGDLDFYNRVSGSGRYAGPIHMFAPKPGRDPMAYATRMDWAEGRNWVILTRDGVEAARMTLDEWRELGAVRYAVDDGVRQALHDAEEARRHSQPPDETAGTAARAATPPAPRRRARAGASSPE